MRPPLLTGLAVLLKTVAGNNAANDLASMPSANLLAQAGATLETTEQPDKSIRHDEEKTRLLVRTHKSYGNWDTNHPRARLLDALFAYTRYGERSQAELKRWKDLYKNVPRKQQNVLENTIEYSKKFDRIDELIGANAHLCKNIVDNALAFYDIEPVELSNHIKASEDAGRTPDRTSVAQSLKHYVRDWSAGGKSERDEAFPCITATMQQLFPDRSQADVKVLLPGSGLGRLGHEISALGGFSVTNNEWSMYMNLAYRFLESHPQPESSTVHPFIDAWSHHSTTANMLRGVSFPDAAVNPNAVLLVEGDFTTVFTTADDIGHKRQVAAYDAIVTHFFIDTARNLMAYLDTIYKLLRPGGFWVNFGPLLYGTGPWVQLSLDEVVAVIKAMGFEFVPLSEECGTVTLEGELVRGRKSVYGFDDLALTRHAYAAQSWAVRRVAH